MEILKWTDRKFQFGYSKEYLPFFIERLKATAPRMEELTEGVPESLLSKRENNHWSIKEHIGHLSDLEELHEGRIEDFKNTKSTLRAADMSNEKTYKANHNNSPVSDLVNNFREKRSLFIKHLLSVNNKYLEIKSLHPRLQQQVNIADLLYFIAEHDNQHLATISQILLQNGIDK